MTRLFITGTDTDVGKTAVTCALARGFRSAGRSVAALKPAESGCEQGPTGLVAADATALRLSAGMEQDNCLYRLRAALAPGVAARREGVAVDLEAIPPWVRSFSQDVTLVEGAGGWFVPLTEEAMVSDLARMVGFPVLIVARPSLGTINHTLLTLSQVAQSGLEIAGFAMSEIEPVTAEVRESNVAEIAAGAALLGVRADYVGHLPHGAADTTEFVLAGPALSWFD